MATKKQKQELMDILKFTPITVTVNIQNYGGECYMSKVDRKIYEYFKEHKIDLDEYASDWDDNFAFVPEDMRPFPPGSPYDCNDWCQASGPEVSNSNIITIEDENGNIIWECAFGLDELEEQGVEVDEWETAIIDDEPDGTVIFWGGQGEKGLCFGGDFELKAPFDPKKLKIGYSNCDGWWLCNGVSYDEEELDNNNLSTTGKWGENKWIIVGDEEVYQGVSRDDIDEDDLEEDSKSEWPTMDEHLEEVADALTEVFKDSDARSRTDWFTADTKPAYKGEYEVHLEDTAWPFTAIVKAEWTGRTWKNSDGKKIKFDKWRGLAENPNEM